MAYTVTTWASDVRNAETKFCTIVADCLEQFNNGNSTDLAKLLCITHGKKSGIIKVIEGERLQYAAQLKRVLAKALQGVDFKFDAKKKSGVKFKASENGGADTDVIQALRVLSATRVQSKAFKDAFPVVKKDKGEKSHDDMQKHCGSTIDRLAKEWNMPRNQVKAMFSAA